MTEQESVEALKIRMLELVDEQEEAAKKRRRETAEAHGILPDPEDLEDSVE